jgi:tRNA (guanine-N7-)-methyltransferase
MIDISDKVRVEARCTILLNTSKPLVLELGCGSGEYTLALAEQEPLKHFIGVDIKGDRLFKGTNLALSKNLDNVSFLRTQIENLNQFFKPNTVDTIWITFPDPQPNDIKKRLTSPKFLDLYKEILVQNGTINLKTDGDLFYSYTLETLLKLPLTQLECTSDLYSSNLLDLHPDTQTHYEKKYLAMGKNINFIRWKFG